MQHYWKTSERQCAVCKTWIWICRQRGHCSRLAFNLHQNILSISELLGFLKQFYLIWCLNWWLKTCLSSVLKKETHKKSNFFESVFEGKRQKSLSKKYFHHVLLVPTLLLVSIAVNISKWALLGPIWLFQV